MFNASSWQAYALGSAFFAGLTAILAKVGVEGINSNLATLLRTLVILAIAAGIVTWQRAWQTPGEWSRKAVLFLVLSAVATGLSWLCYFRALQMAKASQVAPVDKLSVAFAIVLAFVFLREPVTWRVLLGGGLVVAGALMLAWPEQP
jgi:transporter family protein